MFYDGLIIIALLMFATAIVLPLNGGEAFASDNLLLQLYLGAVCLSFFVFFWRRGGQTLGMRAWKIKLVTSDYRSPSYAQLLIRAASAIPSILLLGLGVLWSLIDKDKLALHDRLSNTRLVHTPNQ